MRTFIGRFVNTSHGIKKIDKRLNINDIELPSHLFHVRFAILACGVLNHA